MAFLFAGDNHFSKRRHLRPRLDYPYSFYFSIFSVQGPFQSPLQPRLPQRQAWSVDRITDSFRERHAYAYAFKALKSRNSLVYLS